MASKLIFCCILEIVLLGYLGNAQYPYQKPGQTTTPQKPGGPASNPNVQTPKQPQNPQNPSQPQTNVPFHSCEVEPQYKIQCGLAGTPPAECEALNCCYDGMMCYYGKAVTLQCTKDGQFIVVVARDATQPIIDLESVSFLGSGQGCEAVGITSAFVIYQFYATSCGTVMMEEPGVLIYENRLTSSYVVAIGPYGSITRDSHFDLLVQCRYIGTTVEAVVIQVSMPPPPFPAVGRGPLEVELRLGSGQCDMKGCIEEDVAYNSYYMDSEYPVVKVLRDPVYVEVRMLHRTDPNLVLTLGHCWVTCDFNRHSHHWDLLIDGCPYREDRYQTQLVNVGPSSGLEFPSHYRRFIFKMFTFVSSSQDMGQSHKVPNNPQTMIPVRETVYIHCNVSVCTPSHGNTCEPRCFRKRREAAGSVKAVVRDEDPIVSSGPIQYVTSAE